MSRSARNVSASLVPRAIQTAGLTTRERATRDKKRRAKQDPYRAAQAAQRRAANLQRQEVLRSQEAAAFGDPVNGVTTPFLESLDLGRNTSTLGSGTQPTGNRRSGSESNAVSDASAGSSPSDAATSSSSALLSSLLSSSISQQRQQEQSSVSTEQQLNHHVTASELADALAEAKFFTQPYPTNDPEKTRQALAQHEADHAKASEILRRLLSLENGSTRDQLTANIDRCVDKFGRHRTDAFLAPRAKGPRPVDKESGLEQAAPEPTPRAGPDTGSSEVQIAILTTKIRRLAQKLAGHRGFHDKANHRTLRLLVHKRQRLLRYMERKERGSERWTHMLQELGLTPASWKGQITM